MPKKRTKARKKVQSRQPVRSNGSEGFGFIQSPWATFFGVLERYPDEPVMAVSLLDVPFRVIDIDGGASGSMTLGGLAQEGSMTVTEAAAYLRALEEAGEARWDPDLRTVVMADVSAGAANV